MRVLTLLVIAGATAYAQSTTPYQPDEKKPTPSASHKSTGNQSSLLSPQQQAEIAQGAAQLPQSCAIIASQVYNRLAGAYWRNIIDLKFIFKDGTKSHHAVCVWKVSDKSRVSVYDVAGGSFGTYELPTTKTDKESIAKAIQETNHEIKKIITIDFLTPEQALAEGTKNPSEDPVDWPLPPGVLRFPGMSGPYCYTGKTTLPSESAEYKDTDVSDEDFILAEIVFVNNGFKTDIPVDKDYPRTPVCGK
jgi:hypothetical protein